MIKPKECYKILLQLSMHNIGHIIKAIHVHIENVLIELFFSRSILGNNYKSYWECHSMFWADGGNIGLIAEVVQHEK